MAQGVTDDPDGGSWPAASAFEGRSPQPVERPLFRRLQAPRFRQTSSARPGRVARTDADRLTDVVDLQYRIEAELLLAGAEHVGGVRRAMHYPGGKTPVVCAPPCSVLPHQIHGQNLLVVRCSRMERRSKHYGSVAKR